MKEGNETSGASENKGEGEEDKGYRDRMGNQTTVHHIWPWSPGRKLEDNVDEYMILIWAPVFNHRIAVCWEIHFQVCHVE